VWYKLIKNVLAHTSFIDWSYYLWWKPQNVKAGYIWFNICWQTLVPAYPVSMS